MATFATWVGRCVLVLSLTACGDDGGEPTSVTDSAGGTATTQGTTQGTGGSVTSTGSGTSTASTSSGVTSSAQTSTADATGAMTGSDDTVGTGMGPVELYRGPVVGGVVPGWDPDAPRPLLMMGRMGQDWLATLARLGDDGSLSDNVADEIIVWGFATDPPLLYDGPVGGMIEGWDATDPTPLVMLGYRESDGAWWSTLSTIGPDGTTGTNVADRIVVWGWPAGTPASPSEAFAGPLDAQAALPSWDPDDPTALVLMGTFTGTGIWQSTLARISPTGGLSDNLANELRVWSWP